MLKLNVEVYNLSISKWNRHHPETIATITAANVAKAFLQHIKLVSGIQAAL